MPNSLALFLSALLLGSMLFFAAVVTPSIFQSLDKQHAAAYLRTVFPRFYFWGIILSALAMVSAAFSSYSLAIVLTIVLAGFLYSRYVLLPRINAAKDLWANSQQDADKARFDQLHRISVVINIAQMVLLLTAVIYFGIS